MNEMVFFIRFIYFQRFLVKRNLWKVSFKVLSRDKTSVDLHTTNLLDTDCPWYAEKRRKKWTDCTGKRRCLQGGDTQAGRSRCLISCRNHRFRKAPEKTYFLHKQLQLHVTHMDVFPVRAILTFAASSQDLWDGRDLSDGWGGWTIERIWLWLKRLVFLFCVKKIKILLIFYPPLIRHKSTLWSYDDVMWWCHAMMDVTLETFEFSITVLHCIEGGGSFLQRPQHTPVHLLV